MAVCRAGLIALVAILVAAGPSAASANIPSKVLTLRQARANYYSIKVQYPQFGGSSAVVRKANADLKQLAKTQFLRYQKAAREGLDGGQKPDVASEFVFTPTISIARRDVISVYFTDYSFTGGAHGNSSFDAASFGLVKGKAKKLMLADLFVPGVDAKRVAGQQVYDRLKDNPEAEAIEQGTVTPASPELTETFVLTPTAISFLIPPYAVGPYAAGEFYVKVPFAGFGSKLARGGPLNALLAR